MASIRGRARRGTSATGDERNRRRASRGTSAAGNERGGNGGADSDGAEAGLGSCHRRVSGGVSVAQASLDGAGHQPAG